MLDTDTIGEYVTEIEKEKEAEAEKKKQKKWCLYAPMHLYYIINFSREINSSQIGKRQKNKTRRDYETFLFVLFTATTMWNAYRKSLASYWSLRSLNYYYERRSQSGVVSCFQ